MLTSRAGEETYDVAEQDLATVGVVAQARGFDDRCAEAVVVLERDVARAQPDAHLQVGAAPTRQPVDRLLDRDRGAHRLGRGREDDHEAVAQRLDLGAAVRGQRVAHERVVRASQVVGPSVAQVLA